MLKNISCKAGLHAISVAVSRQSRVDGQEVKKQNKKITTWLSSQQRTQSRWTRFLWTDEQMEALNNWFAHRLWRGRTCAGLLLCKITVQCFSHALYVHSSGMGCGCICGYVSFCLFTCQDKTLCRNDCVDVCVCVCVSGSIWMSLRGRKHKI